MKVRVLNFNLGKSSKLAQAEWNARVADPSWNQVLEGIENTVLVVATQEDIKKDLMFLNALKNRLSSSHASYIRQSPSHLRTTFTVGLLIAVPIKANGLVKVSEPQIVSHATSMGMYLANTKASLMCDVLMPGFTLTVIASHLPFAPKGHALGQNSRLKSARNVVKTIDFEKSIEADLRPRVVLWTGDMNFRETDIGKQLDDLMGQPFMRTLRFRAIEQKSGPTCKKWDNKKEPLRHCQDVYKNKSNYDAIARLPQKEAAAQKMQCYNPAREPSYCAQLLCAGVHGASVRDNGAVAVLASGTELSDHNPTMTDVVVCVRKKLS